MEEKTPKANRRKAKTLSKEITTENVGDTTASEAYKASEPKQYKPPKEMVPLNDERYMKKERVGSRKAVRAPGHVVQRIGLGNLQVFHQNPINYNGDIDV
jgi:hypothetical protein